MTLAPKIAISDDFLRSFAAIQRSQQQAVLTFVAKFRQNPLASGINYERINDAADKQMRSVRINDNIRGIVLAPDAGNVYCLLWVDHHDDAYQWARRHKVAIHPDLGSVQVYAVQHEAAPAMVAVAPAVAPKSAAGLFDALKDRQITRLGVPQEMLAKVRAVTSDAELEQLEPHLPDEAFEALFLFAAGEDYDQIIADREAPEQVNTSDYTAALGRSGSRRHFLVLTEDSDLEALLAAPLERWRVFLHPSQRKLVERDWNGSVKVTGGAGTGKTVVAMHRARRLAQQYLDRPGKPVVFTTFTRTLAEDIRQQMAQLCTPQELEKIQVVNLDQWANQLLRRYGCHSELLYDATKRRHFWKLAMTAMPTDESFPQVFMQAEYERVILPQGCETCDDYLRARRVGRGGQLSRATRKAIWPVFAEYRAQLTSAGFREPEEAFRDLCQLIRNQQTDLGICAMVVDEAQDISAAGFALIRAAVPVGANDLFLVGDPHQRIYRHRVVLNQLGIEVRGRSRKLRVNYRTTDEIRRWACAQLAGCTVDDLDGNNDTLRGYRSLTHGEAPEVLPSASVADDAAHIIRLVAQLQTDGMDLRQICVVARTNDELQTLEPLLKGAGLDVLRLDANTADIDATAGIRLATMHRVKGLEFSVIIIAAYKGAEVYAAAFSRDEDAGVADDTRMVERCLLHVAATRAKRNLFVLQR